MKTKQVIEKKIRETMKGLGLAGEKEYSYLKGAIDALRWCLR